MISVIKLVSGFRAVATVEASEAAWSFPPQEF